MRKVRPFFVVLLLMLPLRALADHRPLESHIFTATIVGLNTADYTVTKAGLRLGAREKNPLLRSPLAHEPAGAALVFGLSTLQVLATQRLAHEGKVGRIAAWGITGGFVVLKFFVIRHNFRVIDSINRKRGF